MAIKKKGTDAPASKKRKMTDTDLQVSELPAKKTIVTKAGQQQKNKLKQENSKTAKGKKAALKKTVEIEDKNVDSEDSVDEEDVDSEDSAEEDVDSEGSAEEDVDSEDSAEEDVDSEDSAEGDMEEDVKPPSKKSKTQSEKNKTTVSSKSSAKPAAGSTPDDSTRQDDRDRRTLFIKNLPGSATVKIIKALSKDIKQVRLRTKYSIVNNKRARIGHAYLEFANEEIAEKNFKILDGAAVRGWKIVADYVGSKSTFHSKKQKTEPAEVDPLRLYVSGLPENATDDDLRRLFPEASEIVLPRRNKGKTHFGYGFLAFKSPELAKKYHDESQDIKLHGRKLTVLYARKQKQARSKKQEKEDKKTGKDKQINKVKEPAAKKVKKAVEDNDEDEEEDEEESDDQENLTSTTKDDSEDDDEEEDDDDDSEDEDDDEDDD